MPFLSFKGKTAVENYHWTVPHHTLEFDKKLSCLNKGNEPSLDDNLIIEGDNLLALKALLPTHSGKIKCIYIDPPYNTGNEGWIYNDNLTQPQFKEWIGREVGKEGEDACRHDKWCCMMYPRLSLLKELLREDGAIFISIDDNEVHHLRKLMDEIYSEDCFINCVSVKTKESSGASGGGEDKRLKKNIEYLLIYSRRPGAFQRTEVLAEEPLSEIIAAKARQNKRYEYSKVLIGPGKRVAIGEVPAGDGDAIKVYSHEGYQIESVSALAKIEKCTVDQVYSKYLDKVFRTSNAQTSIRDRVARLMPEGGPFISADYVPRSGRDKGKLTTRYFIGNSTDMFVWLRDTAVLRNGEVVKLSKQGTLWDDLKWTGISAEGGVDYANGKKPVRLIERVLEVCLGNADNQQVGRESQIVLDSYAGSGTTGEAVLRFNDSKSTTHRFVLVQVPKETLSSDEQNICKAITAKRIHNVSTNGETFTYARLSEKPLFGEYKDFGEGDLPAYEDIAKYIFYTETSREFPGTTKKKNPAWDKKTGRIGEHGGVSYYLLYKPNRKYDWGIDTDFLKTTAKEDINKELIVYSEKIWLHREQLRDFEKQTGKRIRPMLVPFNLK